MKTTNHLKYLALLGSYQELTVGLFHGFHLIAHVVVKDQRLSSYLLVAIEEIVQKAQWHLNDLDFIAVDQGPGSFNSLRAMLATVNGIAYASKVPLIGCDGLTLLANVASRSGLVVVVLNAYNNELYYRIERVNSDGDRVLVEAPGYAGISEVLEKINQAAVPSMPIWCIGNGYSLLQQAEPAFSGELIELTAREMLDGVSRMAITHWANGGQLEEALQALYLKKTTFKKIAVPLLTEP